MNKIELIPELLCKEKFSPYGEILSTTNSNMKIINNGFAQKHYDLCVVDSRENNGLTAIHIYVAKKREFPLKINMLEKHPNFSQVFISKSTKPFLVVVALGNEKPDLSTLKAFYTDGEQGVHYKRGVWHFPLISLEENEQFIVIDRTDCNNIENKVEECIEHNIENIEITLMLKIDKG